MRRIRAFQKKKKSKTAARHNSENVTLRKKVSAHAGLPKRVRSPRALIHTCAGGGWRTQHAHRNCSFFFCSGSFFFNASSSSQGGFSAHFAQCSYAPDEIYFSCTKLSYPGQPPSSHLFFQHKVFRKAPSMVNQRRPADNEGLLYRNEN